MAKPRCRLYPHLVARRHCPGLDAPISARACKDKFLIQVECPDECVHIPRNLLEEIDRLNPIFIRRKRVEKSKLIFGFDQIGEIIMAVVESTLSNFAHWYPELTDEQADDTLATLALMHRGGISGIVVEIAPVHGYRAALLERLQLQLTRHFLDLESKKLNELVEKPLEALRGIIASRNFDPPRAYLDFLAPFYGDPGPELDKKSGILMEPDPLQSFAEGFPRKSMIELPFEEDNRP